MPTRRMPTNKLIVSLTVVTAIALVGHEAFAETIASNEADELMPADAMPMSRAAVADPDITMRALRSRDPTETETSEERSAEEVAANFLKQGPRFLPDLAPVNEAVTNTFNLRDFATRASNGYHAHGLPHGGTSSHQASGAFFHDLPFLSLALNLLSRGSSGHPAPGLPHGGMRGHQAHGASPHGPPFRKSSLDSLPHGPSGQQAHGGPPHGPSLNNPPLNSLSRGPSAAEPQPTIDFLSKGLSGTDDNKPTIDSLADEDTTLSLGNRNDPRRSKVLRQPVEYAAFPGPGRVEPDIELGLSIGGTSRVEPDVELGLSIGGTSRVGTKAADDAQSSPSRLKRKREDSEFVRNVRSGGDA